MKVSFWNSSALTGVHAGPATPSMLRRFREDESGVLAKPMVAILLCMLGVAGIGMDVVHLERDRTNLQYTLDRAVLAAADLDQPLDAENVVLDYMGKADLGEYPTVVDAPTPTASAKRVTASVDTDFTPIWLRFAGYDSALPLEAAATAEESIGNVEISLVLDVSGSMQHNNRLYNLKNAAKEFVETMDANTEDGNMTISIVPYSTQVSMPAEFLAHLNVTDEHSYSHCVNFASSDFDDTGISQQQEYQRTMHFSVWGSSDYRESSSLVNDAICAAHSDNSERTALLFEDDVATLKSYITDFSHSENTSIDVGMKWGTALLDPSVQPIIAAMSSGENATIDASYADRPVAYSDTQTLKVVVLMTDGQNTQQYYVNEAYRDGPSKVWYNEDEDVYTTYDPSRSYDKYYWHNLNRWEDHAYGNGSYEDEVCTGTVYNGYCYYGRWKTVTLNEPGVAEELSFADLFADTSLQYIFYYLFYDWMDYYDARDAWYYDIFSYVGSNTKDTRTRAICDAAKDQGIVVFTIGFEAPSGGQEVLSDCASSDSHYYDVDGLEISDAFSSIASAIRQLRLTE